MKVPSEESADKAAGAEERAREERLAAVRRRLASGYYTSSSVLDRLAARLLEVLRRRG